VNLNRLSNRETLIMVSHLLRTEKFDKEIEQLVLEKTEGIPFFIEQLISSLNDQRIIEKKGNKYYLSREIREVIIPSTIQDVIMARVDLLPEQAKGLLQKGAVAGREFSHRLIKKVADVAEEELLSYLSVLKDSELLYERGIYPQSNYVFKHALTQEVAYNSLVLTYSFLGMAYLRLGKVESALRLLEKGNNLCLLSKIPFGHPYAAGSLGYAYLLANEPRRALTVLKEGTKPSNLESGEWIVHPLTVLADAYRAVGDIALATETVSRALTLADEGEERGFEAWPMLLLWLGFTMPQNDLKKQSSGISVH
jgi:tetratricopeptide (TPR) repeat protein